MQVLISPGFGAGWSTWNEGGLKLATDPRIIEAFSYMGREEFFAYCEELGYGHIYGRGYRNLRVVDVPSGVLFRINEHDGAESIEIFNADNWERAI